MGRRVSVRFQCQSYAGTITEYEPHHLDGGCPRPYRVRFDDADWKWVGAPGAGNVTLLQTQAVVDARTRRRRTRKLRPGTGEDEAAQQEVEAAQEEAGAVPPKRAAAATTSTRRKRRKPLQNDPASANTSAGAGAGAPPATKRRRKDKGEAKPAAAEKAAAEPRGVAPEQGRAAVAAAAAAAAAAAVEGGAEVEDCLRRLERAQADDPKNSKWECVNYSRCRFVHDSHEEVQRHEAECGCRGEQHRAAGNGGATGPSCKRKAAWMPQQGGTNAGKRRKT